MNKSSYFNSPSFNVQLRVFLPMCSLEFFCYGERKVEGRALLGAAFEPYFSALQFN